MVYVTATKSRRLYLNGRSDVIQHLPLTHISVDTFVYNDILDYSLLSYLLYDFLLSSSIHLRYSACRLTCCSNAFFAPFAALLLNSVPSFIVSGIPCSSHEPYSVSGPLKSSLGAVFPFSICCLFFSRSAAALASFFAAFSAMIALFSFLALIKVS